MTRRVLLVAAGVLALVLAIVLAALGRAVLETPHAVAQRSASWPANARLDEHRTLAERTAERLLAADRAQALVKIVDTYRRLTRVPIVAGDAEHPLQLARMIPSLRTERERAQAHMLVGAIFALPAGKGTVSFDLLRRVGAGRLLDEAAAEFRAATRIDDRNEKAKYDLELLLKGEAQARQKAQAARDRSAKAAKQRKEAERKRRRTHRRKARPAREEHAAGIYASGSGY